MNIYSVFIADDDYHFEILETYYEVHYCNDDACIPFISYSEYALSSTEPVLSLPKNWILV